MWTAIGGLIAGLIGLPALISNWFAKRQGEATQRAKDAEQALDTATLRERVEAADDKLSTDELRRDVRSDSPAE